MAEQFDPPLRSDDAEEADCRAAFARRPRAQYAIHLHHESLAEPLSNLGARARISYILTGKPPEERALRLRLFRPVTRVWYRRVRRAEREYYRTFFNPDDVLTHRSYRAYIKTLDELHREACQPGCTWTAEGGSIFEDRSLWLP